MGKLADSFGRSKTLTIAMAFTLAGCLMTLLVPLVFKIVGLGIFTFGFFGAHATASGWVGQIAPKYRSQASSFYLLFYYAGSSIVGVSGGLFWSAYGWKGVIGLIAALLVIAFMVKRIVSRAIPLVNHTSFNVNS